MKSPLVPLLSRLSDNMWPIRKKEVKKKHSFEATDEFTRLSRSLHNMPFRDRDAQRTIAIIIPQFKCQHRGPGL